MRAFVADGAADRVRVARLAGQAMTRAAVTAIVVNYRTPALAIGCVRSLAAERTAGIALDVMLVDGGSDDGSAATLAAAIATAGWNDWVELVALDCNGGFGWANNQAIRRIARRPAAPAYVYLVNPDATVTPGTVARLVAALRETPRAAAAGGGLRDCDGGAASSAFRFPSIASEFFRGAATGVLERLCRYRPWAIASDRRGEADWVTGANVLLRIAALREVGLFDEGYFLYFEEVDLMRRFAAAGWSVVHDPAATVTHIGGAATGVTADAARLPPYWFRSRKRYFALAFGRAGPPSATLAWVAGAAIWRVRRWLGLASARIGRTPEARDLWRTGLFASRDDLRPAIPALDAPIPDRPAWLAR